MNDPKQIEPPEPEKGEGNGEDEEYQVGHGNPPKEHQFKKGNKKGGRKKGSKGIKTIVNEAAGEKVSAQMNGKVRKIPKGELAIHQVFSKAAAGDHRSALKAIELQERYGPQDDGEVPTPEQLRPDIETLRNYLGWLDTLYPPGDDDEDEGDDATEGDDD